MNIGDKYIYLILLYTIITISCNGQKTEEYVIPLDGVIVYVEGLQDEGWLTANPFGELVMLDSNTQDRYVLTWDHYYYAHPNLTPNGKSLIFESKRANNIDVIGLSADSEIYQMDLESKEITNLNNELSKQIGMTIGQRVRRPSLSPTGDKLAIVRFLDWEYSFSYFDYQKNEIIDLSSDIKFQPVNDYSIEWSNDEKKMIFTVRRGFSSYVVLLDLENNNLSTISNEITEDKPEGEVVLCNSGSWVDSTKFIYLCKRSDLENSAIYEFDTNTNKSVIFKTINNQNLNLDIIDLKISKEANKILLLASEKGSMFENLYMLNVDSDELSQITFSATNKKWLRWYENQ